MIEAVVIGNLVEGVASAGFWVDCAVDDSGDASLDDSAGTHRARFQGDIERAVQQPPGTQGFGGLRDGNHLGMRGRVFQHFALIVRGGDDSVLMNDDGANGDFRFIERLTGFFQSEPHPGFVQRERIDRIEEGAGEHGVGNSSGESVGGVATRKFNHE